MLGKLTFLVVITVVFTGVSSDGGCCSSGGGSAGGSSSGLHVGEFKNGQGEVISKAKTTVNGIVAKVEEGSAAVCPHHQQKLDDLKPAEAGGSSSGDASASNGAAVGGAQSGSFEAAGVQYWHL